MSFLRRKKNASDRTQAGPMSRKKRIRRIVLICIITVVVVFFSYIAYLVASGSKAFENGFGGQSLLKTLIGGEKLKGENEDRVNILLMGMGGANHPGGLLADSIMVISIRPSDKKIALLSIPRDLQVSIKGHGDDKINTAYADGYNDYYDKQCTKKNATACKDNASAEGAKLSADTVSKTLDIPIHYYVTMDFAGFEKIIDQLGGVDVNVTKAIYDPFFPDEKMKGYAPFSIKAGQQHLDGKTALKYARSRETTSDFDRAKRQQQIVSAVKDKATKAGFLANPKKVADVISTLGTSIKVSFTLSEMKSFAEMMNGISVDNAVNEVLSNAPDNFLVDFNQGTYFLKPKTGNFKSIQNFVHNIFNYDKPETAKIDIQNGSKTSGLGGILSESLESSGYTISSVTTAKQKIAKTLVYDLSGGTKKKTATFLKSKFNVTILQAEKKSGETIDFRIIIGDDYNPNK